MEIACILAPTADANYAVLIRLAALFWELAASLPRS
jgi:hypothetical protein